MKLITSLWQAIYLAWVAPELALTIVAEIGLRGYLFGGQPLTAAELAEMLAANAAALRAIEAIAKKTKCQTRLRQY